MLIVFAGLPGTGKSTIARELARLIDATWLRIDSIEQALRGWPECPGSLDDAGYRAAYSVAADNLRLGRTVIADSVNPIPLTRDAWYAVAQQAGVPAVEIEVVCSDVGEHRRRIESRVIDVPGLRLPTWENVVNRDYRTSWSRDHHVIDTAGRSAADCIQMILEFLPGPHRG